MSNINVLTPLGDKHAQVITSVNLNRLFWLVCNHVTLPIAGDIDLAELEIAPINIEINKFLYLPTCHFYYSNQTNKYYHQLTFVMDLSVKLQSWV